MSLSDPYGVRYEVPVDGGPLHVARAGLPPEEAEAVILAAHGITASSMAWRTVARDLAARLPISLLVPDLRGRGRSAGLPEPYGFASHVADLLAVLDDAGVERAVIAGHSMGAYVAARLAADHPERAGALVLVDGGMPIAEPPEGDPDEAVEKAVAQLTARLPLVFDSVDAYAANWAAHPAYQGSWDDDVDAYARYDVAGEPGAMRCVVSEAAVRIDIRELLFDPATRLAAERVQAPMHVVRAARGLQDEPDKPWISDDALQAANASGRYASVEPVADANHYTVVLGAGDGPRVVAAAVERAVAETLAAPGQRRVRASS